MEMKRNIIGWFVLMILFISTVLLLMMRGGANGTP